MQNTNLFTNHYLINCVLYFRPATAQSALINSIQYIFTLQNALEGSSLKSCELVFIFSTNLRLSICTAIHKFKCVKLKVIQIYLKNVMRISQKSLTVVGVSPTVCSGSAKPNVSALLYGLLPFGFAGYSTVGTKKMHEYS